MDLRNIFSQAVERHKRGDLAEAEQLYRQIIAAGSPPAPVLHLLGTIRSQSGKHEEALELIARALKAAPREPHFQWSYANELSALGRFDQAVGAYDNAIALSPGFREAFYNRGIALGRLNRHQDAVASFEAALHINPNYVEALYQRGQALEALSQADGALESYRSALQIAPDNIAVLDRLADLLRRAGRPDDALTHYASAFRSSPANITILYRRAHFLLALDRPGEALSDFDKALSIDARHIGIIGGRAAALQRMGREQEALDFLDRAQANFPDAADLPYFAGTVHQALGQAPQALALYDKTLALNPRHAGAWNNKGAILLSLGELSEVVKCFEKAVSADPNHAEAWLNLGNFHKVRGQRDEALESYNKCLAVRPDLALALHNRGLLLWEDFGKADLAGRDLQRAYALNPQTPYLLGDLLHLRMQVADWSNFGEDREIINRGLRSGQPVARPFMYQAICEQPADMERCATIYVARDFPLRKPAGPSLRPPTDKIRLGYLSGEFRDQATTQLMAGLYEMHDKSRFEVIAFDNGLNDKSAMRARLESAFDKMIDISHLSDQDAAARVAANGIDILVNLNGYFGKARMGVFAHRPAPVQVNYLGFPSTLGADYIDYIIADRHVIPAEERRFFIEKTVWLPDTYQVNDSKRFLPTASPPREQLDLPRNGIVFCNFNQSYKITPETFRCWMHILTQVDGSVLWLLQSSPQFRENLRAHAAALGVDPGRLVFATYTSTQEHLTRLGAADLCLDTLPYNAHTTASDALWAGVPVLTCTGSTFAGRVATSLLHAIGMPELVTPTMEAFQDTAISLAKDPARLQSLRNRLQANRLPSALFDTDRFRKNIETAFEIMHDRATKGFPPAHFSVERP